MTRNQLATAILGIAALGGGALYATADSPVCELHTVFGPCEQLRVLRRAANVPACSDGETIGAVLGLKFIGEEADAPAFPGGWVQPPGLVKTPVDCSAFTWPSDAPEDRVQVVPVETMHPDSIAGMVGRQEQRFNGPDGAELLQPAEPPHLGYCYGAGCYCAEEPCEHVAIGAVDTSYPQRRLCHVRPDAPGCEPAAEVVP